MEKGQAKCDRNTEEKGGLGAEWNREEEEMASEEGLEGSGNMDIVRAGTKHLNLCQHLVKSSFKVCTVDSW